ncbi:unnamed protein product [Caenorhabditis angaria]|uniref:NTF2-like domain-containing protein n=1 Tax=Caenorhabditis angaria TaxID=860376 RepID=A0A9P1IG63_9PELO|nr:unnamed protein product [Caenorhabditis angaria]
MNLPICLLFINIFSISANSSKSAEEVAQKLAEKIYNFGKLKKHDELNKIIDDNFVFIDCFSKNVTKNEVIQQILANFENEEEGEEESSLVIENADFENDGKSLKYTMRMRGSTVMLTQFEAQKNSGEFIVTRAKSQDCA